MSTAKLMGRQVAPIGFGMMGLTAHNPSPPIERSIETLHVAASKGPIIFNGGEFYGPPTMNSLVLLKAFYEKYPEDKKNIILNIKGALQRPMKMDPSPEGIRGSVTRSLEQLGDVGTIDAFECARFMQHEVPLEVSIQTMVELKQAGKIGAVALSEVSAKTIRAAAKITEIASVEIELSLWSTEALDNGIVEACSELNIPILAYSPIGRGFLSGAFRTLDDLPADDLRRRMPRFQPGIFEKNFELLDEVKKLASKKGCTPAQLAINWVRCLGPKHNVTIIPIPGASSAERVKENSTIIDLSDAEMKEINDILKQIPVTGGRYPDFVPTNT